MPVYDDQDKNQDEEKPAIGPSLPGKKSLDNEELEKKENGAGEKARTTESQPEQEEKKGLFNRRSSRDSSSDALKDGLYSAASSSLPIGGKLATMFTKRLTKRNAMFLGGGSLVITGAIFMGAVAAGPLAIIHFSQLLQKYHFKSNEDFGDSRTSRVLLYAALGQGTQKSRLGLVGNGAANKWEKSLRDSTGMRPVYSSTGRFVGFEMVDEKKAEQFMGDAKEKSGKRDKKALERIWGNGASVIDAKNKPDDVQFRTPGNNPVDGNRKIVYLGDVSFADRKKFIKLVGKSTGTNRAVSAVGSRLLVKRGGVDFHPMNKLKDKLDKKVGTKKTAAEKKKAEEEALKEIADQEEKEIREGTKTGDGTRTEADSEGNTNEDDAKASDEAKSAVNDFKQGAVKTGLGAAAVAAVACMVKDYGNKLDDFQHANSELPMMRAGVKAVAKGDQLKAMSDFDMTRLSKIESKRLTDPKTKQTFAASQLVQAEQGKEGGVEPPPESQLSDKEKPKFFQFFDGIPGLGTMCAAQNAIGNLPIIKQVGQLAGSVSGTLIDGGLSAFGTNQDELMEKSFKTLSGKAINTAAVGPEYGSIGMIGGRLAANDQIGSMGGGVLSARQSAELKADALESDRQDFASESIFARYFDAQDERSLAGKTVAAIYNNQSKNPDIIADPISNVASVFSNFLPSKTASAAIDLDALYGMPAMGFSLEEQRDERFEDPYKNADIVEPQLDELNNKYGVCFALKIIVDETSSYPHIETTGSINQRKLVQKKQEYKDCGSNDEMSLRYRFYIGDTVSALSVACYQGDSEACTEIMPESAPAESKDPGDGDFVSGSDQELAKKIVNSDKFTAAPQYKAQLTAYADGKTNCHINPTILELLATILDKGYTINVFSLNRKCTGVLTKSGTASYHYSDKGGHAVDIAAINGVATTGRDANAQKLLKDILNGLPNGSGIGQSGCGASVALPNGVTQFGDSCNHLHIQVPKQ